ncbi:hypothetical protein MCM1_0124 [Methanosarcina barkeri CM1]|uniref:Uncharacterized protein n=1 Tax=Methanosarcina barkeri CM1 TaxID=796385 RepID=A0A0G3C5I8_METBA|nr:hypothetical protein MCM1_0124 [Methanosarcina barkeri CM1]
MTQVSTLFCNQYTYLPSPLLLRSKKLNYGQEKYIFNNPFQTTLLKKLLARNPFKKKA